MKANMAVTEAGGVHISIPKSPKYVQPSTTQALLYNVFDTVARVRMDSELPVIAATLSSFDDFTVIDRTREKVTFLELRKYQIKARTCQPGNASLQLVSASKLHT
jgi:hypothetical protein